MDNMKKLMMVFCIVFSISIFGQDSTNIIILSENIGSEIDKNEREFYNILPKFNKGFLKATYYLDSDSLYYCKIIQRGEAGEYETRIRLHYNNILNTAFRIQYHESLLKGKSNFLLSETKLKFENKKALKGEIKPTKSILVNQSITYPENILPLQSQYDPDNIKISILKKNGDTIDGKFLYVRDSLVYMLVEDQGHQHDEKVILADEIKTVKILKDSKVLTYMGNGFLIGLGIGAAAGFASGDEEGTFFNPSAELKALLLGGLFGVVGGVVGLAVGVGESEHEEFFISDLQDLRYLNQYVNLDINNIKKSMVLNNRQKHVLPEVKEPEKKIKKKIGVSIVGAGALNGPANQFENQLIKSGFNETTRSFFSDGYSINPKSSGGGMAWLVSLKYFYTMKFSFGGFYSKTPLGMSKGYNEEFGHLYLSYEVNTLSAMTWLKYGILNLGVGPSLHFTKTYSDDYRADHLSERMKVGLSFELAITYPSYSFFYVTGLLQFRLVGSSDIGPFEDAQSGYREVIFPSTSINYNHFFLGFGAGFRI